MEITGKRMNKILIAIIAAVLLYSINLFAQADSVDLVLTIDRAVSMALQKNYDVRMAGLSVQKAEEQITEAYSGAWPKLRRAVYP